MANDIIEELKRASTFSEMWVGEDELVQRMSADERLATDRLIEFIRYRPVLEALFPNPLDRGDLERQLNISRATSHRFTKRLIELDLIEKIDGTFSLTGYGEAVSDETLRYETNVRAARRLAPLLDVICEFHREFVVGSVADATVTTADPEDPYRPVNRFVALARESDTFRGFNTTQMVPLSMEGFHRELFEKTDTEVIYLPDAARTLLETYPERAAEAIARGHLALRSRDALPYGLAIFDEQVGIGGYDEETGTLRVFVDTDAAITREWAEGVYELYRRDSEPLDGRLVRRE
ncbi:MAG TPA: MarR family transcriptional regulator [Halococcus sp.]|nr:MarR family transcriptional regulator [Halococcus sp.]